MKEREEHISSRAEPPMTREGVFDAQLSFPASFGGAPEPILSVIKRDGTFVPFETRKIAASIFHAAESAGEADLAHAASLASGVAIYLGKTRGNQAPTVTQIQDAVERVLVEMGHVKTALAYARYQRKRERVRRLKQGDIRAIISAGVERQAEPFDSERAGTLFVRTSDERLLQWERERIVDALVRETGLEYALAESIAAEVEHQVQAAQVRTLTASLVRELVDAKLIEHGLERYRKRHMRLGVPLYDAEQILCAPNQGQYEGIQHPGSTDLILAERVKKEFAFSQVFSQPVVDAHLAGDLHIHDVGLIDRLHAVSASLEYVKRFGSEFGWRNRGFSPARDAETLLAQATLVHEQVRLHVADSVRWTAFNVFAGPFVEERSAAALARLAEMFRLSFRQPTWMDARRAADSEIQLCADVPEYLRPVDLIGFAEGGPARRYEDCLQGARRSAEAILAACTNPDGPGMAGPRVCIQIPETSWTSSEFASFLDLIVKAATAPGGPVIEFDRAGRPARGERDASSHGGALFLDTVLQRVTLNLPRAAYRARRETPLAPEQGLLAELRRLTGIAARAHAEKRDFIERLMMLKDLGPLSLLASERDGAPLFDLEHTRCLVALTGINEAVQALTGTQLHQSEEAFATALRIANAFALLCAEAGETHDLRLVPALTEDDSLGSRFAMLDLDAFELLAQNTVKTNPMTHDIGYTPGGRLAEASGVNPMERLRLEGMLSEAFPNPGISVVPIDDDETSAESLGDFIRNAFYRTRCRRFVFTRS